MIYNTFKKRKHVIDYNTDSDISQSTVDNLLQQAWELTPSKQNFMPYNIYVLGPQQQHLKEIAYNNCCANETDQNKKNSNLKTNKLNPGFRCILSSDYLLIFTKRLEDQPNAWQQKQHDRGVYLEPLSEKGLDEIDDVIALETGLFANCLSGLCLEQDLDVSYTLCFKRNLDYWKEFPFIKRKPMLLMTIGKGRFYQQDLRLQNKDSQDFYKPDYERIVKFI